MTYTTSNAGTHLRWNAVIVTFVMVAGAVPSRICHAQEAPNAVRQALGGFYAALEAGDAAGLRALLHTSGEAQSKLADALADQLLAAREFGVAMKARFAATNDILTRPLGAGPSPRQLARAVVEIKADEATVKIPGAAGPVRLKRDGQAWRIVMTDLAPNGGPQIATQIEVLQGLAQGYRMVARDTQAGKYTTPEEAERALSLRLQEVIKGSLPRSKPATRSTQPAQ